ncbi:MAG: sodium:solute symporter family protein [Vicinamibacterales bacterium]
MTLTTLDWAIIVLYFIISAAIGVLLSKRGSRSVNEFFLSGRNLPWWLAGTSMVATTFAADTPLAVAGLVARNGIAGNWIWWSAGAGSMLTVFFFARLWRRAGILTDVEFAELRYTGRPAAILRGFRALYLGIPINCVIMGWVNLAMAKILAVTLGWDRWTAVLVSLAITGIYSALSGLWGVVVTDFFQFAFAMAASVALAYFALSLPEIGGLTGLRASLPDAAFAFVPDFGAMTLQETATFTTLPLASFLAYVCVQWWASWYPGQEPGGGGYVAQRMMSAKDERHSLLATLWFTVAHYCVRPWPWIIVGLASLVLYPELTDKEAGYVYVMRDHLPVGWRGLMLGAFFAAYMSTISTQLNWGTSYIVNDFYRRFLRTDATDAHYVWAGRVTTIALMMASAVVTFYLESIRQAWEFVLESGAGIGLVLILRWYWWRINAWSEIAAMVGAAIGYATLKTFTSLAFPDTLLIVVAWTTVCWLVVTFLTTPESDAHLIAFYRRVRPDGAGWARIASAAGEPAPVPASRMLLSWVAGTVFVYAVLFGTGRALLDNLAASLPYLAVAVIAAWVVARDLSKRGWRSVTD